MTKKSSAPTLGTSKERTYIMYVQTPDGLDGVHHLRRIQFKPKGDVVYMESVTREQFEENYPEFHEAFAFVKLLKIGESVRGIGANVDTNIYLLSPNGKALEEVCAIIDKIIGEPN